MSSLTPEQEVIAREAATKSVAYIRCDTREEARIFKTEFTAIISDAIARAVEPVIWRLNIDEDEIKRLKRQLQAQSEVSLECMAGKLTSWEAIFGYVSKLEQQLQQAQSEDTSLPIGKSGPPCCGKVESVKWNPFNGVVQCHSCGTIYEAQSEDTARLGRACDFIRFQAESWSNTGDTNSLRQAMRSFVRAIDAARKEEI